MLFVLKRRRMCDELKLVLNINVGGENRHKNTNFVKMVKAMRRNLTLVLFILFLASCSTENNKKEMGLFDRFKKEKIAVTTKMIDEDQFWAIIETAKKSSDDLEDFAQMITANLAQLSTAEIIGFHLREQKLRFDSYTSDLWCAAYIMNGGCSDDCFEYFRCWIIAQGKAVFYSSLKNPDSLVNLYSSETEEYDFEDLMYVASEAFEQKTGKDIEDFIDYNQFKTNEAHHPDFTFTWEEDNEESMKKICPQLMEKAWD